MASNPTTDAVRTALVDIEDPDLGTDVVTSGLVDDIQVVDGAVTLDASFAGLPTNEEDTLVEQMRRAIFELPGVQSVRVEGDESAETETMTVPGVDRILAVASAKGGVGKTTVATQLARGLAAEGKSIGLFDADVYGPNVPAVLGIDGPVESTANGRARPLETAGLQVLSLGCLANDEPLAWRGAMAHEAVLELLTNAAWDNVDTLVLDLPPGTGDIVLTTLQELPVDGTVLVTTPFETATGDTDRSGTLFREQGVPVFGTVVNMAEFTCPSCGDEHAPFGTDADVDADVLAELPIDDRLRDASGEVPSPFVDLANRVLDRLEDVGRFAVPPTALDIRSVPMASRPDLVATELADVEAGESKVILTDRQPGSLVTTIRERLDCDPAVRVQRYGSDGWALQLRAESTEQECQCSHPSYDQ